LGFELIIGQGQAVRFLKAALERGRVAHAYLFYGPHGVGKTMAAKVFATKVMERGCRGCGRCGGCNSILEEKHPDLLLVAPQGTELGIDQIRQLRKDIQPPPFSAPKRVIIIEKAHRMTREASNAFLKTLEEPEAHNIFILEAPEPGLLLPTILSRCQKIRFRPLGHEEITMILAAKGIAQEKAGALARLGNGSVKRALDLLERGLLESRPSIYLLHMEILKKGIGEIMLGLDPLIQKLQSDGMAPSEYLALLEYWYRDLLVARSGLGSDMLMNHDFSSKLKAISEETGIEESVEAILEIEQARQDLARDANPNILLQDLVWTLKEAKINSC
jgi:DNA polymerase-3 subunit delta'